MTASWATPALAYFTQQQIAHTYLPDEDAILLPCEPPCHLTATEHRSRVCYHLSRPGTTRLSFVSWPAFEAYWNHWHQAEQSSSFEEQSEVHHG